MMRRVLIAAALALLGGCAGPPLTLYTLAPLDDAGSVALASHPLVVQVSRIAIPDALDSQDILVRDGNLFRRSATGRWASRLSLALTDLVTARLAARMPQALITDQPQSAPVTERLTINISGLDVNTAGRATLQADWTIIPADPALPLRRDRARISVEGSAITDAGVVALVQELAQILADKIRV